MFTKSFKIAIHVKHVFPFIPYVSSMAGLNVICFENICFNHTKLFNKLTTLVCSADVKRLPYVGLNNDDDRKTKTKTNVEAKQFKI